MTKLGKYFTDDYEREVSLSPALALVITPVVASSLLGFNLGGLSGTTILGFEVSAIAVWLLSNTIRDAGKALETRIFRGVLPTTSGLRLRENSGFEVNTRRDMLMKVSSVELLSIDQERYNPDDADQRIKYAVDVAKERMRNRIKFKLLRRELKSYGFWRNMVAVRAWGFGIALASTMMSVAMLATSVNDKRLLPCLALSVSLLGCIYWLAAVREVRVIAAAERYKDQFFKSLALL